MVEYVAICPHCNEEIDYVNEWYDRKIKCVMKYNPGRGIYDKEDSGLFEYEFTGRTCPKCNSHIDIDIESFFKRKKTTKDRIIDWKQEKGKNKKGVLS